MQAVFQHVKGVSSAVSGYAGGQASTANYDTVSGGRSGHAEAVEITYDPAQVSYGQLLQIFGGARPDPAQPPGPDTGTQYRSAVFPASDSQRQVAEAYIAQLNRAGVYGKPMATTIEPLRPSIAPRTTTRIIWCAIRTACTSWSTTCRRWRTWPVFPARYQDKPVLVYP